MNTISVNNSENSNSDSSNKSEYSFKKRTVKKRNEDDMIQMDIAVGLVLKNKLSLRAASHLYKIPFSTLRTRKIYLSKHPEKNKSILSLNDNNEDINDEEVREEEGEEEEKCDIFENDQEDVIENDDDCQNKIENNNMEWTKDENVNLIQLISLNSHEQPNNKQSLINKSKKTLKIKFNLNGTMAGKNEKKRLYIKHDKLDHIFNSNGANLLIDKKVDIDKLLKRNSKSRSNENHFKGSPIKLSALFSKSILSKQKMNLDTNKIDDENLKKNNVNELEEESKNQHENDNITQEDSIIDPINKSNLNQKDAFILNKYKKFLIKPNENNDLLFKCSNCKLLFVDLLILNDHQKTCSNQNDSNSIKSKVNDENFNHQNDLNSLKFFKCSFCKNVYPTKLNFMSHLIGCNSDL